MSKKYREENPDAQLVNAVTSQEMRKLCQRPGRLDEDGNPIYTTEQVHAKQCDVNYIIAKYDKEGIINHLAKFEYKYGDMTANDFAQMTAAVLQAKQTFEAMPSKIRNEFDNSPEKFLAFMDDPANRDKAIELGLIDQDWTPETDGIGEHVKSKSERKKKTDAQETEAKA